MQPNCSLLGILKCKINIGWTISHGFISKRKVLIYFWMGRRKGKIIRSLQSLNVLLFNHCKPLIKLSAGDANLCLFISFLSVRMALKGLTIWTQFFRSWGHFMFLVVENEEESDRKAIRIYTFLKSHRTLNE